jgi:hypothetical protein
VINDVTSQNNPKWPTPIWVPKGRNKRKNKRKNHSILHS